MRVNKKIMQSASIIKQRGGREINCARKAITKSIKSCHHHLNSLTHKIKLKSTNLCFENVDTRKSS